MTQPGIMDTARAALYYSLATLVTGVTLVLVEYLRGVDDFRNVQVTALFAAACVLLTVVDAARADASYAASSSRHFVLGVAGGAPVLVSVNVCLPVAIPQMGLVLFCSGLLASALRHAWGTDA